MRREAAGIQALSDGRWRVDKVLAARFACTGGVRLGAGAMGGPPQLQATLLTPALFAAAAMVKVKQDLDKLVGLVRPDG
eukprot:1757640-Prymnesium_polylepis.1